MKKLTKLLAMLLAVCMMVGLFAACKKSEGGDPGASTSPSPSPTTPGGDGEDNPEFPVNPGTAQTLKFFLWTQDGAAPAGFDKVLAEYQQNYAAKLGVNLEFRFASLDEYKTKINLDFAAGTMDYDVVFDADWLNLSDFAKKGYYYNLADDFATTSKNAGLKKAFSQSYLKSNYFSGGMYAVPLNNAYASSSLAVTYIRKDWREKCATDTAWAKPDYIVGTKTVAALADGIDDHEELMMYLAWVKDSAGKTWTANGKTYRIPGGTVAYAADKTGTYSPYEVISTQKKTALKASDYAAAGIKSDMQLSTNSLVATAYIKNGEVIASSLNNEKEDAVHGKKDYPQGFNTAEATWQDYYTEARLWYTKGLIDQNVMSVENALAKFTSGNAGAAMQGLDNFNVYEQSLKAVDANAELEIYVHDKSARDKEMGTIATDFKAWNFLCVPKQTSQVKKDAFITFMNWLFYKQENSDLFWYGVKGTHWQEALDESGNPIEGSFSTSFEGVQPYGFPAYLLVWNPTYARTIYASDPKVMEYSAYQNDIGRYVAKIYPEFSFDKTVSNEIQTALKNPDIDTAYSEITSYKLGLVSDPIAQWNAVLKKQSENNKLQSDLDLIREELIKQLQNYIDNLG